MVCILRFGSGLLSRRWNSLMLCRNFIEKICFPLRNDDIKDELDNIQVRFRSMKENYDIYVPCIDETVPENEARQLIKEAAINMNPKPETYLDYARNKLQIAQDIGLITKSTQD